MYRLRILWETRRADRSLAFHPLQIERTLTIAAELQTICHGQGKCIVLLLPLGLDLLYHLL